MTLFFDTKAPECFTDTIPKNNNLNFLRLLLAYIVVIFHSMNLSGYKYPLAKLFNGHIAVRCFFIISGFLIIRSFWSSYSLKEYIVKRCKRLLPAYFLVIIICTLFLSLLSNLSIIEYFKQKQLIKYLISNIFFMNFLQPSLPGVFIENKNHAINGSLWTIKLEIGFYLIVPIIANILYKLKTKKRINTFLALLYIFGYIYKFLCLYISKKYSNHFMKELAHQLPGYIQYFSVGIFCAINYNLFHRYGKYLAIPGMIFLIVYYTIGNDYFLPIGLMFIIIFIGFNFSILNAIGKIGDYSYGVYIFHFPIIQILVSLGYFNINKYVALLVTLGTVFSISYLSWHFIEKKILKR